MKHSKILTSAASIIICLAVSFGVPVSAAAGADLKINYINEFAVGEAKTIGWDSFAVSISDGGIFTGIDGNAVSFGGYSADKAAEAVDFRFVSAERDAGYPVLKTCFYSAGAYCTLTQFVDKVSFNGLDVLAVYSSLTAKANKKSEAEFPQTSGLLIPLGDIPGTVEKNKTAKLDYVTPVFCNGELTEYEELADIGSFDERYEHMTGFWDEYVASHGCFAADAYMYSDYRAAVIDDAMSGNTSAMAVYDGCADIISADMTPFTIWLMNSYYGLPDGFADSYDLASKLDAICADIKKFDCSYADEVYLYAEDGAPTAEGCFEALSSLEAGLELLPLFGITDTKYEDSYQKLLLGTETVFLYTVGKVNGSWELYDLTGSDVLIFPLSSDTSAGALCSWYIKDSAMGRFDSGRLNYTAREAFRYVSLDKLCDICDAALAIAQPTADGGLLIGRGVSADSVTKGIKAVCPDKTGGRITIEISANGNNVIINTDGSDSLSFTVSLPFFKNNIESATCAFDADSSVLTPSAGTKSVSVTLKRSAAELAEEYAARTALEIALFEAAGKSTEGCTDISKREFEAARDSALAARTAGIPAAQMSEAAEELIRCNARLSKIISGYIYTTGSETVGQIANDVTQKFTLPKSGTVTEINISGVFGEGTVAKIYDCTEKNDLEIEYIEEAAAEMTADGMRFRFNFEAEADKDYALELYPDGGAAANVTRSDNYMTALPEAFIYTNAALSMEINVEQADRTELDAFYEACQMSDVSRYTRESVKNLQSAMHTAADLLRTPDAEAHECEDALWNLKLAFSSLTTYASDMKVTATSPVLYILIGVTIILLTASLATASAVGHKKNDEIDKDKDKDKDKKED